MKRSWFETILGAVVIAVAVTFFVFSYKTADVGAVSGYSVVASFTGTGGLSIGDDVRISGVKIGSVQAIDLDPETYLANVTLSVENAVKLPTDTAALISSESLLGGRFMALEPGADEDFIEAGGKIQFTQAPQNLEQLLGEFIFSVSNSDDNDASSSSSSSDAASMDMDETQYPDIP